jgi:isopenicillin N synthase-like dioxygenase
MSTLLCFCLSFALLFSSKISAEELDIHIPVVDMHDFYDAEKKEQFLSTLYEAMSTVGFFAVRNTGIDKQVIEKAYAQAKTFFKQDLAYKEQSYVRTSKGQRGFVPGEIAKGAAVKDAKEFYHIGFEGREPLNVWPEQMGFKEDMLTLYNELLQYVVPLQQAIVETINWKSSIKIPTDYLNETTKEGDCLLRALYYPPISDEQVKDTSRPLYWGAPHTDIDYLAILPYATEKGLQVEVNGEWLTVVVPEDAFIVNAGDMLQNLTNGLFVSAKHRVMALEPNKERFSMVLFVHPHNDTLLDPLPSCVELTGGVQKYAPGTRKEFLWERLIELDIAPGLLDLYSQTGHTERQLKYGRQSPQVVKQLIDRGLASQEVLDSVEKK